MSTVDRTCALAYADLVASERVIAQKNRIASDLKNVIRDEKQQMDTLYVQLCEDGTPSSTEESDQSYLCGYLNALERIERYLNDYFGA